MSGFERIATVLPKGKFNHNLLPGFVMELGRAFEARGLEHVVIDGSQAGFQRDVIRCAADGNTAIYVGHRFYDLSLSHAEATRSEWANLFELFDCPVFARIADHPFAQFMWQRIEAASRTAHFLVPSLEFKEEAQFINPTLANFHKVTASTTIPEPHDDEILPLEQRPIDIFMPCGFSITSPSVEEMRQVYIDSGSAMARVIDETLERGTVERDSSVMEIFFDAIERHFGGRLVVKRPLSEGDQEILQVLHAADTRIRTLRRVKVLESLAQVDSGLRVVVTAPESARDVIPRLRNNPNFEYLDNVDVTRARQLQLASKFVVNVNPTYTSFVSERVRNAMALGCCVISDKSLHAAETFAEGQEILFMDGADVSNLDGYFMDGGAKAQSIAAAGRARVLADFTIGHLADDIIQVMKSVLG